MPDFYSVNGRLISIRRLIDGVYPPFFQWFTVIPERKIVIAAGVIDKALSARGNGVQNKIEFFL